jgi:hypothetical protein
LWLAWFRSRVQSEWSSSGSVAQPVPRLSPAAFALYQLLFEASLCRVLRSTHDLASDIWHLRAALTLMLPQEERGRVAMPLQRKKEKYMAAGRVRSALATKSADMEDEEEKDEFADEGEDEDMLGEGAEGEEDDGGAALAAGASAAAAAVAPAVPAVLSLPAIPTKYGEKPVSPPYAVLRFPLLYRRQSDAHAKAMTAWRDKYSVAADEDERRGRNCSRW